MPFTSLVIWLENSESFMKVIIRVIYRSHHHTHSPMNLCCAVLGRLNLKKQKPSLQQNHPLAYLGQSTNSQEFLSLQQRRLQTAWIEIQDPYALQLCNEISVLIFSKAPSPHSQQQLGSKLHDRVYRNMHLYCQQLNPVLWIQYLSIASCKNMY